MLAALGLFVFERATLAFSETARRSDWNHAASPRVGARDASQYVGPGADTITINGALVPEAGADAGAIRTLRRMADQGDAWSYVLGTGEVVGTFVITALDERAKAFYADGVARKTDFAIDLLRVDD